MYIYLYDVIKMNDGTGSREYKRFGNVGKGKKYR